MPRFSHNLERTLHNAISMCRDDLRELATLEDLLIALANDPDAKRILSSAGLDFARMRKALRSSLDRLTKVGENEAKTLDPSPTSGFQTVIARAIKHVESSGDEEVTGANVLISLFSEKESDAAHILEQNGLSRVEAIRLAKENRRNPKSATLEDLMPPKAGKATSEVDESPVSDGAVKTSSEPSAGTAIGVHDAVHRHQATSPTVRDNAGPQSADSSAWTGMSSRAERLAAVRPLLPVAANAVESLIASLEASSHNGGPILDEAQEAIDALRNLHRVLGEILSAIDRGSFDDEMGEGLTAEAMRHVMRAYEAWKHDPMPYTIGIMITAVLTACGHPSALGFLATMQFQWKKPPPGK